MGTRGPVGKRTAQKHGHRSKEELTVDTAPGASNVTVPDPDPLWHPAALQFYDALQESGQAHWYEPSDWALAFIACELLTRCLASEHKTPSQLVAEFNKIAQALLATEGDRRRVKIELDKATSVDEDEEAANVTQLDAYRRLSGA